MTLLTSVKSALAAGTPIVAFWILWTVLRKSSKGIVAARHHDLSVARMSLSFFSSSSIDLKMPSNVHPRSSLLIAHAPSNFLSFLSEIGSSSSSSSLAGNTL